MSVIQNGMYQNVGKMMVFDDIVPGSGVCPRSGCGENAIPGGRFLELTALKIPLKLRVLFFDVTIDVKVTLQYCSKCGFLRIFLVKA